MLQHEFEERIGHKVSEKEYTEANAVYEMAGDMDKDTFCQEWKAVGGSPLVLELASSLYEKRNEVASLKDSIAERDDRIADLKQTMFEQATEIVEVSSACVDDMNKSQYERLEAAARKLANHRSVIIYKLNEISRDALSPEDMDYIVHNIK